jgi:polyisoprenoid-binding protein YceI
MPPATKARTYNIDTAASLFTVQAFASGIASVVAHSPKFAVRDMIGHAQFSPETGSDGAVELTVGAASLELMDDVSRNDRQEIDRIMFGEVLEVSRFPSVKYKSSQVSASKISENTFRLGILGELTLHGFTRGIGFDATLVAGEDTLRAQGAFSLLQSDYGIVGASIAGGSIKLRDELKLSYFIIARRRK